MVRRLKRGKGKILHIWLLAFLLLINFLVTSLPSLLAGEAIPCVWTDVKRIVAIGDIHGDYERFVAILKGVGVIDGQLHWKSGNTHLVQTGDILDRGPKARMVFDLLLRLEKEAEAAGGKVHQLIGNHEEMNITGIAFDYPGYVTLEQFLSFLPDEYRLVEEANFLKKAGEKNSEGTASNSAENSIAAYWEEVRKEASKNYRHPARKAYTDFFNENYGRWLLKHNAVIKINGIVFVHGGISKKYSTWKLEDLNSRIREQLKSVREGKRPNPPVIVYAPDGPYWYRDFAILDEERFGADVYKILANLGAEHMVIAHTPQLIVSKEKMMRFGGKIWIIDTGISRVYGGNPSALIIEDGERFLLWPDDFKQPESFSPQALFEESVNFNLLARWVFFKGRSHES